MVVSSDRFTMDAQHRCELPYGHSRNKGLRNDSGLVVQQRRCHSLLVIHGHHRQLRTSQFAQVIQDTAEGCAWAGITTCCCCCCC
jgi:hypothetical protein